MKEQLSSVKQNVSLQYKLIDGGLILSVFLFISLFATTDCFRFLKSTLLGKSLIFAIAVAFISSLFVVQFAISKFKLRSTPVDITIAILFIYLLCNGTSAIVKPEIWNKYIETGALLIFYIVLRGIKTKALTFLFSGVIISGVLQAVIGVLQLINLIPSNLPGFRITGSFLNPGPYASYLGIVFILSLGFYLFKNELICNEEKGFLTWQKIFNKLCFHALVPIGIILPATRSRAALLAVVVCSILLIIIRFQANIKKKFVYNIRRNKRRWLFAPVVIIVLAFFYVAYYQKKDSADGRILIWKVSSAIVKLHAPFGVGNGQFQAHYMDAQAHYFERTDNVVEAMLADNTYYAFNDLLEYFVENGFVGLLVLLLLIVTAFRCKAMDAAKYLKIVLLVALGTFSIFAFFSYPMQILPIKVILVLIMALLSGIDSRTVKFTGCRTTTRSKFLAVRISVIILLISPIIFLFKSSYAQVKSLEDWNAAERWYTMGLYNQSVDAYRKASPYFVHNGEFMMRYGKALTMAEQYRDAVKILHQAKRYINSTVIETSLGDAYKGAGDYIEAERAYEHANYMVPNRLYPEYLLVRLYIETNNPCKAKLRLKKILKKKIKVNSRASSEIVQYAKSKLTLVNNNCVN